MENEKRTTIHKKESKREIIGDLEHYQLAQSEYDREHSIGITFENSLLEFVKKGNVDAVKELMNRNTPEIEQIGVIASSSVKQTEYLLVTTFSLLTRAVIEGGVRPEEAYEMGDVYLQKLERCNGNMESFTALGFQAMYEFAKSVKDNMKNSNIYPYIGECKDYIAKHLRKEIKVSDIAPIIGISRTYLAHKFKDVEGITVQQYIMRERCKHAANLLKYSNYPISLISEYFYFSSQSYFGKCFKEVYGMSPKKYRRMNYRMK